MPNIKEFKFENKSELVAKLNKNVIKALSTGIEINGKASMLLSGGTTPGPLYQSISQS